MGLQQQLLFFFFIFSQSLSYYSHAEEHHAINNEFASPTTSHRVINVDDFSADGDGPDDTKAFKRAWHDACSSLRPAHLMITGKSYLLKPVVFNGPCKSPIIVKIEGTIIASSNRSDYEKDRRHWIVFEDVKNLVVRGGGTLNGMGRVWWMNSCKINSSLPCSHAPTALTFYGCKDLKVEHLNTINSQQIHISIEKCNRVELSKLSITAPEWSPNTDGIHVADTKDVSIIDCVIKTGDDCISIVTGSRKVRGKNIVCGPGHGISIGSLGANHSKAHVSDVKMDTVTLSGTMNGVRIKTWQGGHGNVKNVIFQSVQMHNVGNPILIDQNYCDSAEPCHAQKSAVEISQVFYKSIRGTSSSKIATRFDCSKEYPCHGILLQDIHLIGENGDSTTSSCNHAKFIKLGTVVPRPCI